MLLLPPLMLLQLQALSIHALVLLVLLLLWLVPLLFLLVLLQDCRYGGAHVRRAWVAAWHSLHVPCMALA